MTWQGFLIGGEGPGIFNPSNIASVLCVPLCCQAVNFLFRLIIVPESSQQSQACESRATSKAKISDRIEKGPHSCQGLTLGGTVGHYMILQIEL